MARTPVRSVPPALPLTPEQWFAYHAGCLSFAVQNALRHHAVVTRLLAEHPALRSYVPWCEVKGERLTFEGLAALLENAHALAHGCCLAVAARRGLLFSEEGQA